MARFNPDNLTSYAAGVRIKGVCTVQSVELDTECILCSSKCPHAVERVCEENTCMELSSEAGIALSREARIVQP